MAWSQQPQYRREVAQAKAKMQEALASCHKPYVAFSGGKDSTVMTSLVLQQRPNIMTLHWDYGRYFIPQMVHEEIIANARALGACNLRLETSPLYEQEGRRATNVLGRHMFGRLVPQLMREGYDRVFVGLRTEESLKRRRRIRAGRNAGVIQECWPLADMTWMTVWAYIIEHNLPYLSLYDERAALVGYDLARFTTLFDQEFHDLGTESVDGVLHWRWRNAIPH